MTHWRSSCENPRSVWMDGSATFTTAMSRTTMNWTVQSRASASHLRREAFTATLPFVLPARGCKLTARTFKLQVDTGLSQVEALHSVRGQAVRPVLPDRPRAVAGRRALGAARRAGAHARPEALHRSRRRAARHRD